METSSAAIWQRILRADETLQAYFAERSTLDDAVLFTCAVADEFNLAIVDRVLPGDAERTLRSIERHYRNRGASIRARLSPLTIDCDWPRRLTREGFVETEERRRFWTVPDTVRIDGNPAISVSRASTPEDADRFSAIQAAAFGFPPGERDWDRMLARRSVAAGRDRFYLGWLNGEAVGVAASMPVEDGIIGLWGLATDPGARGHGVGTAILQRMIDDARATPGALIFFTTSRQNTIEHAYRRFGFEPLFQTQTFERSR